MTDVIQKGYAELVPQDRLQRQDGKVWYISHHAVYHKRKKTFRVVFNCSSTFQQTSHNDKLLQAPDLANPLVAKVPLRTHCYDGRHRGDVSLSPCPLG